MGNKVKSVKPSSRLGLILILGASLCACGSHWKEEVQLHDGSTVVVERSHERGGRHEITSGPPIKEQSIAFTLPGTTDVITWRDEYSDVIGSASFVPLALHLLRGTPYLVLSPYGCTAYNIWGRPNPPYVIFRYADTAWQRIQITEFPTEFKTINLVIGTSNQEKNLSHWKTISSADVQSMNRYYRPPEYRSIVREPVKKGAEGSSVNCDEMILYKGYWIVKDSPTGRFMVDQMIERNSRK